MAKDVFFNIRFQGQDVAIRNATDLRLAISEINKELKVTEDADAYAELEEQQQRLKAQLELVNAEQRKQRQLFQLEDSTIGAYKRLTIELKTLRDSIKDTRAAGGVVTDEQLDKVQALDLQLKDIDAEVGQFQRNVGNYPQTIGGVFDSILPRFGELRGAFSEAGDAADTFGRRIAVAFVAFQVLSEVIELVGQLKIEVEEFAELRREVEATLGIAGEQANELTARIRATSVALGTDFNETLIATNALITRFGVGGSEAIDLIDESLLRVGDRSEFISNVNEELRKLVGLGIEPDSALAILVDATNQRFNVDVVAEPLLALREQTKAAEEALEAAFGPERTKELFATFQEAPLQAIQEISAGFSELDSTSRASGLLLADVFKAAGEDDITAVLALQNISTSLEDVGNVSEDLLEIDRELLDAQNELASVQTELSDKLDGTSAATEVLQLRFSTLVRQIAVGLLLILDEIPVKFEFVRGFISAFTTDVKEEFEQIVLTFQIAGKQLQKLNPFGAPNEQLDAEIEALRDRRGELGLTFSQILENAQRSAAVEREKGQKRAEAAAEASDQAEISREQERTNRREEIITQREQSEIEAAEKLAQRLEEKQRETELKAIEAESEFFRKRTEILKALNNELANAQIEAIESERTRLVAAEEQALAERLEKIKENERAAIAAFEEQRTALAEAFGEESEQVTSFVAANAEARKEAREQFAALEEQEIANSRQRIIDINKKFDEQELQDQLDALAEELNAIERGEDQKLDRIEAARARGLKSEEEAAKESFDIQRKSLQEQLALIDAEIATLNINIEIEDIPPDEIDTLVSQREELNRALAVLEEQQTEKILEESEKRMEARQQEAEMQLLQFEQRTEQVSSLFEFITEAEVANIETQIEAQEDSIARLEDRQKDATGAQKVQLDKRITQEKQALEGLNREKEAAEKRFAGIRKAIDIAQTISAGARAIIINTAQLGFLPAIPINILQGALTAAQIALIAAQPVAEGGEIVPLHELDFDKLPKIKPGRVNARQNIKRLPSGDNVLAAIQIGETVINQESVKKGKRIFGEDFLRIIGVPGYQTGGITGTNDIALGSPDIISRTTSEDVMDAIGSIDRKTDAISARIDNLKVFLVTDDLEDDTAEAVEIQTISELSQ